MDTKVRVRRLIITYTAGITIFPHIDNTQSTGHKSQQDKMHKRVRKDVRSPIDLLVIGGGNSTSVYTLSHTQLPPRAEIGPHTAILIQPDQKIRRNNKERKEKKKERQLQA